MTDYAAVLTALHPDALWGLTNNDLRTLTWDESNADAKPTKKALDSAWPAVRDARAWAAVRTERDRLLVESDWTQMPDSPLNGEQKNAWADYRQTLRDIPQTQDDPDSIVWPETP
jgi:hypothetical protein